MSDPETTDASTESKRLREKLMPQTSIRFFLLLIAVSAVVMLVFRSAAGGAGLARIVTLLISTSAGCFIAYAVSFLVGNLFSATAAPLADAIDSATDLNAGKQLDSDDRETS